MSQNKLPNKINLLPKTKKGAYRDLAIALALNGAFLMMLPATAKADTTSTSSTTSPTTTSAVEPSTTSTTTAAPTVTATPTSTTSSSTDSSTTLSTDPTTTADGTETGGETPAAQGQVFVNAVDSTGKSLTSGPISAGTAAVGSGVSINWATCLPTLQNAITGGGTNYTVADPAKYVGTQNIVTTATPQTIDVAFVPLKVTATYNFIDESTNKTLLTETNSYTYTNTAGNFQQTGIRPAAATFTSTTATISDNSDTPATKTTDLPYFGPDGTIFNNDMYVLDAAKSGGVTPIAYSTWPDTASITQNFYYTPAAAPTVTLDAQNGSGTTLKTFTIPPVTNGLPADIATAKSYLPTVADATIPGYAISGVKISATGSKSGAADEELAFNFSPDQYSQFVTNGTVQGFDVDYRQALQDYSTVTAHLMYTGNTVNLQVQPVEADGTTPISGVAPISAGTGVVGEKAAITAPDLDGYTAGEVPATTISADQGPIDVIYTPVAPAQVTFTAQPIDSVTKKSIGTAITIGPVAVGTDCTITAPTIAGYTPVNVTTPVTVSANQGTVQLPYTKNLVTFTIQPVDASSGQKIGEPIAGGSGTVGNQITLKAPAVDGYTPVLASKDVNITDGMSTVITMMYNKNPETKIITLQPVDGNGTAIPGAKPITISGTVGQTVPISAPTIEGYTISADAPKQCTIAADTPATVNLTYTKNPVEVALMVQPVDADSNPIGQPLSAGNGTVGQKITVPAPTLDGYTAGTVPEITIAADQGPIPVLYTKNPAPTVDLWVQPIDAEGNSIGEPVKVGSGVPGEKATLTAPEVEGYQPEEATASITVAASDQGPVKMTYTKVEAATGSEDDEGTTTSEPSATTPASEPGSGSSSGSGVLTTTAAPASKSPTTREEVKMLRKSSALPSSPAYSSKKFPQTGNKVFDILSAIGVGILGIIGLCWEKIRKAL
ncbi:MucBP domain-containing protein [Companilactobacillus mishanensis]|uniref:MucBP domain-containing protein n=1 Tax=Companilactobacillus mishanensis TaxID=2486008 RepID=UPI001295998A|nr:MucBP domain-containing protein [Companilactobacillus mishanensis]MQS90164.1 hypothetical protein [Companilactobacillus mishanensis]